MLGRETGERASSLLGLFWWAAQEFIGGFFPLMKKPFHHGGERCGMFNALPRIRRLRLANLLAVAGGWVVIDLPVATGFENEYSLPMHIGLYSL
jgi:hypothetical protein